VNGKRVAEADDQGRTSDSNCFKDARERFNGSVGRGLWHWPKPSSIVRSLLRRLDYGRFQQRRERPTVRLDAARHECLPTVREDDYITRLDVRRGMLDQAEVVAGRIVEAVAVHVHAPTVRPHGSGHKMAVLDAC